jgi:hypothetical protein
VGLRYGFSADSIHHILYGEMVRFADAGHASNDHLAGQQNNKVRCPLQEQEQLTI